MGLFSFLGGDALWVTARSNLPIKRLVSLVLGSSISDSGSHPVSGEVLDESGHHPLLRTSFQLLFDWQLHGVFAQVPQQAPPELPLDPGQAGDMEVIGGGIIGTGGAPCHPPGGQLDGGGGQLGDGGVGVFIGGGGGGGGGGIGIPPPLPPPLPPPPGGAQHCGTSRLFGSWT